MRYSPPRMHSVPSHRSPRDEQNVTEMIKCFNNQTRLRNTCMFEWWDKQAESDVKRDANAALASPVTQASVERTFSGLRYILNKLLLALKEVIIEAIMFQHCNT